MKQTLKNNRKDNETKDGSLKGLTKLTNLSQTDQEKREKTQITRIRNERDITNKHREIQKKRIIKE